MLERMARIHFYVWLLDLEYNALLLYILLHILASIKDDPSLLSPLLPPKKDDAFPIMLAQMDILNEMINDLLVSYFHDLWESNSG